MKDRVIPVAEQIGGRYFQPGNITKDPTIGDKVRGFIENLAFIVKNSLRDGTIIDIGADPNNPAFSPYYFMEQVVTRALCR